MTLVRTRIATSSGRHEPSWVCCRSAGGQSSAWPCPTLGGRVGHAQLLTVEQVIARVHLGELRHLRYRVAAGWGGADGGLGTRDPRLPQPGDTRGVIGDVTPGGQEWVCHPRTLPRTKPEVGPSPLDPQMCPKHSREPSRCDRAFLSTPGRTQDVLGTQPDVPRCQPDVPPQRLRAGVSLQIPPDVAEHPPDVPKHPQMWQRSTRMSWTPPDVLKHSQI